jgi:MFS family permease
MATLVIYCVLKLALESCLSSNATLTAYYFDWGAEASGVFLAIVGLLVFPANVVLAHFSRHYDDRELIMVLLIIMSMGAWGIVNYGNPNAYSLVQYITFAVCIFVSATALEGPNMSLLSKTIPKHWAKGLFNVGLLATEAGTLGRVFADIFMTYSGLAGINYLLNRMFISLAVILTLTVAGTFQLFPHLEPYENDDYN